jgi:uncharacterized damage-inducible protein DinB
MDLLDRLIAHDTWTTRQLLLACQPLSDELLDKEFEIDHKSLRITFIHMIDNLEVWTDLMKELPVEHKSGTSIAQLLERLKYASREFSKFAHQISRENRYDDFFLDSLDNESA